MYLHGQIYKHEGRSYSADGISNRVDNVTIVNIKGPISEPDDKHPPVMLVRGPGRTDHRGVAHIIAVPAVKNERGQWVEERRSNANRMMGGSYITGDSRFGEAVEAMGGVAYVPIALHDRFEVGR